jgi:signal transduction histidine kinase
MADKKGIGHTMFTKQVLNLMLVLLNADLFLLPVLPNALPWPEGSGSYVMESLRLLNMAMSLWFFVKVLELLQASRWALKMQRVPLALMAVCLLLLLVFGQLALVRKIELVLYLAVPLGLVVGSLACRREPLHPVTGLGLARRGAERLAFGLVLWAAWGTSFSGGLYRAQDISFFGVMAPIAAFSSVGVLLVLGWRHIRADRQRQDEQQHRAELNTLALDFERGERLRQQEFMSMLTHELKAPLSTLGMVIGSATPSASMRHHATLALASMRQVIDHCAQSADIDDASTPPQLVACWLETELALRCDAQADKARVRIAPTDALPPVLADPRMLAVIFNNLLDNALKYSPRASPISVAITRECHPQGAVQRVSVANQALAGPLPDAARLFQKYYRGDAVQRISGSGLGLHLSRLLARRQGGDLHYEAAAPGVTFTLVLLESPAVSAALA